MLTIIIIIYILSSCFSYPQQNQLGINLDGISYYSTDIYLADVAKLGDNSGWKGWRMIDYDGNGHDKWNYKSWIDVETLNVGEQFDENGYPLKVPIEGVKDINGVDVVNVYPWKLCIRGPSETPKGVYTIVIDGEGEINFSEGSPDIKGQKFKGPGTYTVNIENDIELGMGFEIIETNPVNHIKDVKIMLPGHTIDERFNKKWIEMYKDFYVFRYMNPMKTNNQKLEKWSERTLETAHTMCVGSGMSYEWLIDLSNEADVNAWFCIPHKFDDEWITNFAKLVHERLNSHLKVYLELSNEIWNSIFSQSRYCWDFYGVDTYTECDRWYAERSAVIFDTFQKEFVGEEDRLIFMLAGQSASPNSWLNRRLKEFHKLDIVTSGKLKLHQISIAPYFGNQIADALVSEGVLATSTVQDVVDRCNLQLDDASTGTFRRMNDNKAYAEQYNLTMNTYEGGQHIVSNNNKGNDQLNQLLYATNRDSKMKDLYVKYLNEWFTISENSLFVHYKTTCGMSQHGSWGSMEAIHNDETIAQHRARYPKYDALREFIDTYTNNNPTCKENCNERGTCVGENVCKCDAGFIGLLCQNKRKVDYSTYIAIAVASVSSCLAIIILSFFIVCTIYCVVKKKKSGGYDKKLMDITSTSEMYEPTSKMEENVKSRSDF